MEACVIGLLLFWMKNLSVICVLWQQESQLHISLVSPWNEEKDNFIK